MTPELRRNLRRGVIEIVAVFAVTLGIASLLSAHFDLFGALGLVVAAVVAFHVRQRVKEPVSNPPPPEPVQAAGDPFERFETLRERLRWGAGSPDYFDLTVRPILAELVDDRLIRNHGIERRSDPDKARAIVAPELWELVTGHSVGRPPTITDVAAAVAKVNDL